MPKKQTQRIIDARRRNSATTVIGATGSGSTSVVAGDGLTQSGITLAVGAGDGLLVTTDAVAVDATVVRTSRTVTAGNGLTGGGALSGNITLDVGAGTLITANANDVALSNGSAQYQVPMTGATPFTPAWAALSGMAGNGLTFGSGAFAVGAGTLVTVGDDSVGITAGANYQFIGTGSGTAAAWQNLSSLAGNGLTHSTGVLAVGVSGLGLGVGADAVTLTSSSNPGAAASILATDSAGLTQLVQLASNATFVSGFAGSGYRVDYGVTEASRASAEFDNLTVRGRMRVYELLIQQIRATNGSVFVSSSSKVLTTTADANPLWTVNGSQLTFNGSNANLTTTLYAITTSTSGEAGASRTHYHGFLNGDIIRAQQVLWNGSAFAGVIQSNLEVTGVTNLYTYQGAQVATGDSAPAVGYDYVRLGNASDTTRQGSIYLTSDDSNAPFIDIVDQVRSHADWNTVGKIKTRVGKLSGITDAFFGTLSGYGLYSDNVYLRGSIYATSGVFSGTVFASAGSFTGTVYASAGSFTGSITAASGTVGGWTIGASTLAGGNATLNSAGSMTLGTGNDVLTASAADSTYRLWIGNATAASAPFRVTKAGAVTATDATITGTITANSGSLAGFLTIGASGGIYQGTGTSSSPTNGLKIFRSGDVGQIATFASGTKTLRVSDDDIRYKMASSFTDIRTLKWLEDADYSGSWSDLSSANGNYAYIGAYYTSTNGYLYLSNRVNNTGSPANTRNSIIALVPSRNESSTIYAPSLYLTVFNSTGGYDGVAFFTGMYLELGALTATPTRDADSPQVYVKGTKLIVRYNDGGTHRYKYLELTGTGTGWTHTTSAP